MIRDASPAVSDGTKIHPTLGKSILVLQRCLPVGRGWMCEHKTKTLSVFNQAGHRPKIGKTHAVALFSQLLAAHFVFAFANKRNSR